MAVDYTQLASWGPISNPGPWQTNYWRIPFEGAPHIVASAYINYVSIATVTGTTTAGAAIAAFKRYEFLNASGQVQLVEFSEQPELARAFVDVERCVSITVALDLKGAFAVGGWSFHYLR